MRKIIILVMFFIISISAFVTAGEEIRQGKLMVSLIFPDTKNAAMKAPRAIPKPLEISGQILLDIRPTPSKIEKDRYLVEYFLDDQLIHETTGFNDTAKGRADFRYLFDTTKYENGRHKLIVNFWDENGPSAIGMKEIAINNKSEE